ncbi:MAG: hypothetical protein QXL94_04315, partial [Candidatus Parvarchaeum sp.]
MTKVVINRRYGGFGLSEKAIRLGRKYGWKPALKEVLPGEQGENDGSMSTYLMETISDFRSDPMLIRIVEELG